MSSLFDYFTILHESLLPSAESEQTNVSALFALRRGKEVMCVGIYPEVPISHLSNLDLEPATYSTPSLPSTPSLSALNHESPVP